jgi:hypothetical protein
MWARLVQYQEYNSDPDYEPISLKVYFAHVLGREQLARGYKGILHEVALTDKDIAKRWQNLEVAYKRRFPFEDEHTQKPVAVAKHAPAAKRRKAPKGDQPTPEAPEAPEAPGGTAAQKTVRQRIRIAHARRNQTKEQPKQ